VRHTLGDVLAVMLVHAALRGATPMRTLPAAAVSLAIALAIEAAQGLGLFAGISHPVLRILLGSTFSWGDIAAYAAGAAIALGLDYSVKEPGRQQTGA
jgi:hypothetical protein